MQLHQLRYFVSTVDNRSVSDAAKCCFVSQPSLSQQIKSWNNLLARIYLFAAKAHYL